MIDRRAFLATPLLLAGLPAAAQTYPSRPINLVLGFAPGGGGDGIARPVAEAMGRLLGQQVLVDNRTGAGGTIATNYVASAAPDGYTLYLTGSGHYGGDQAIFKNLKYTGASLTPIARWVQTSLIVTVNPKLAINSVKDLLDYAKSKPERLTYSSAGIGTANHLAGVVFEQKAGIRMLHVPAKGSGPAATMVAAGDVDCLFGSPPSVIPLAQGGRLKMVAVTASQRLPQFPDMPTVSESGLPGYKYTYWWGLYGPAGMPREIVDKLFAASNAALAQPALRATLEQLPGNIVSPSESPSEFATWAQADGAELRELTLKLGITSQ
jgi:tripartite-type tricarboxylate transporter receptor subunit TctC